jgi:hypothetical protein
MAAKKVDIAGIAAGMVKAATGDNQALYERRVAICRKCDRIYVNSIGEECSVCHCFLNAKLRLKNRSCPLDKWGAEG